MRIGLIDVDNWQKLEGCYPNIAVMKLSSWHKAQGDIVEWYNPEGGDYDRVYASKVFSFSPEYPHPIHAPEIIRGGQDTASPLVMMERNISISRKTHSCRTK